MSRAFLLVGGATRAGWRWDRRPNRASAFTLIEAIISTIIVAVMFVAALNTVGAARLTQYQASLVSRGRLLAEALLSEILRQAYRDPDGTPVFGREANESSATRATWDDVDDYDQLSETPPVAQDGTVLTIATGWRRTTQVEWVDPANPAAVVGSESNAKRITVTVTFNAVPQAVVTALRTNN